MRTSTISAAATGRPAACTSPMPLSSICQVRDSTRIDSFVGEGAAAHALGFRQRHVVGDRGHDLHAGDEMGELGEVAQHHRRIGADVVLLAQLLQRRGDVALHQRLEQIDDAHAVGEAEHLPHVFGAHRVPAACAIA